MIRAIVWSVNIFLAIDTRLGRGDLLIATHQKSNNYHDENQAWYNTCRALAGARKQVSRVTVYGYVLRFVKLTITTSRLVCTCWNVVGGMHGEKYVPS